MKALLWVGIFFCPFFSFSQYSTGFDDWPITAEGSWSLNGPGGTYTGSGVYVNFGNTNSGQRKVGFNNTGDELCLPTIDSPLGVSFSARTSSGTSARIGVSVYTNSGYLFAGSFGVNSTSYRSYTAIMPPLEGPAFICLTMEAYGNSIFLDDVSVWGGNFLPVELAFFRATPSSSGQQILLEWQTQTESNNAFFRIERSHDGVNFREIGRTDGAGTSLTPINYAFTDRFPHPRHNYYRLQQVDFDGTSSYSSIQTATTTTTQASAMVYPTLAHDRVHFRPGEPPRHPVLLCLINAAGQTVQTALLPENSLETTLDIAHLPAGRYWIVPQKKDGAATGTTPSLTAFIKTGRE